MNPPPPSKLPDVPFVNEVRLNGRLWSIALVLIGGALVGIPRIWKKLERFETGADYRIPYSLSRDYWLYERRAERIDDPQKIVLLGDSVIWGEYVAPEGTLSHFLNEQSGSAGRFLNGGVNGLFPLAAEGLVTYYAKPLQQRKIIVHCNLLWLSSPKADLQVEKEEKFNHSRLVPQFRPRIACYKATANERLSVVVERNMQFMSWVTHLQSVYFEDRSIPAWTLQDDGGEPPKFPNCYRNPLKQITMEVPPSPAIDPLRGPASSRHKPWTANGGAPVPFEWVELNSSLQWAAFRREVQVLRARGNDVFVILGPFNEHMIAAENTEPYRKLHNGVTLWLDQQRIPHLAPKPLASDLYADASHPLTDGYRRLAQDILGSPEFQTWLKK